MPRARCAQARSPYVQSSCRNTSSTKGRPARTPYVCARPPAPTHRVPTSADNVSACVLSWVRQRWRRSYGCLAPQDRGVGLVANYKAAIVKGRRVFRNPLRDRLTPRWRQQRRPRAGGQRCVAGHPDSYEGGDDADDAG